MLVNKKQLTDNKFYVGSGSIFAKNWGHKTLEDAVEHATELAQEHESDQFVVEIVRVVRVEKAPVKIIVHAWLPKQEQKEEIFRRKQAEPEAKKVRDKRKKK